MRPPPLGPTNTQCRATRRWAFIFTASRRPGSTSDSRTSSCGPWELYLLARRPLPQARQPAPADGAPATVSAILNTPSTRHEALARTCSMQLSMFHLHDRVGRPHQHASQQASSTRFPFATIAPQSNMHPQAPILLTQPALGLRTWPRRASLSQYRQGPRLVV